MITILVDYNMEGQAVMLWDALAAEGWLKLLPLKMAMFADVGLPPNADDRTVWRFAQQHRMLLLTNNRSDHDEHSLERTLQEENTMTSYPVLTIGRLDRIGERQYRDSCVERLVEVVVEIENYLGTGRIFLP